MKYTIFNWLFFGGLLVLFLFWHGAFESRLEQDEIERIVAAYQSQNPKSDGKVLRQFLDEDDGKPVLMVNAIKQYPKPIEVNGKTFGETSDEALAEYTGYIFPYLIKRGSYPLFSGIASANSLESWGIDNAEEWTSGAVVRYRSRRVLAEMVTNPDFARFHDAKIAAMQKTFAFPTTSMISVGNLTLTVFFALLSGALGMQLLINRKKRTKHQTESHP